MSQTSVWDFPDKGVHTRVPHEQQACHTQNTQELLLRCLMPTNRTHSAGVQVPLELCAQRGFKVCRKTKNRSRCALVLICMCTVETLGAALAELWNVQRGGKNIGKKSEALQITSRTIFHQRNRFTVALPRCRTGFRHKPYIHSLRAADYWWQGKNKEVVQFIRTTISHTSESMPTLASPPPLPSSTILFSGKTKKSLAKQWAGNKRLVL